MRTLQEEKGKLYHTQSEEPGKLCGSEPSLSGQRTPEGKRGVLEGAGPATGEENSSGGPAGASVALFPAVCPLCMVSELGGGLFHLSPFVTAVCLRAKNRLKGVKKKMEKFESSGLGVGKSGQLVIL